MVTQIREMDSVRGMMTTKKEKGVWVTCSMHPSIYDICACV